jgi:divalent metal cation (Fe/Co/Zn/Cd) transporter
MAQTSFQVDIHREPSQTRACELPVKTVRQVAWLQGITLAWMLVECSVALYAAVRAHSPVLLAFGSDSFVELLSATIVLLQFIPAFSLSKEKASRTAGVLLFVLAGVVAFISVAALTSGVQAETSLLGIAITIAALSFMPFLARLKRRKAREINNRALAADAVQSATCAYLAAVTLCGLTIHAIFQVHWIDSIAALAAIPILIVEGRRALAGDSCGCC